jgi:hypothetical protein
LALTALCLAQSQARAQGMTKQILVSPPVGLAPGQSARITLWVRDVSLVGAQVKLHDERGAVIAQSYEATIPAGQFRSFNFNRSDIPLAGEAGTGRVQVRASVSSVRPTFSEAIDPVVVSIETISISDGTSNTVIVGEVIPTPGRDGNDTLKSGFGNDIITGIVPGQTLRVSLFNPLSSGSEAGSDAQSKSFSGHVKVFDASGNLIAQSADLVVAPGEFRYFDFNRDSLPLPGEPGTGRLQVRTEARFSRTNPVQLPNVVEVFERGSYEVIDNSTGRTAAAIHHPPFFKGVSVGSRDLD